MPDEVRVTHRHPLDSRVLNARAVRELIFDRFEGKCVYCEKVLDEKFVIDRYRPLVVKGADDDGSSECYVWLALDFDNLVSSCELCNFRKSSNFPVEGARAPFLAAIEEVITREETLLLDPFHDTYEDHIDYLPDGSCSPKTLKGKVSIQLLDLNRDELVNRRSANLISLTELLKSHVSNAGDEGGLREILSKEAEFNSAKASLFRNFLDRSLVFGESHIGAISTQIDTFLVKLSGGISTSERKRLYELLTENPNDIRDRIASNSRDAWPVKEDSAPSKSPWRDIDRRGLIERIEIVNFKGIRKLEVDIPTSNHAARTPCLMILGENSTGKSSILQAISLCLLGRSQAGRLKINPIDILQGTYQEHWSQHLANDAEVKIRYSFADSAYFCLESDDRIIHGTKNISSIVLGYGPHRYFDLKKRKIGSEAHSRSRSLFNPTFSLPHPEEWLKTLDKRSFNEVAQVMRIVLSLRSKDHLVRDADGRFCIVLDDKETPLEWLSEGYKSVFVMVADILRELLSYTSNLAEAEAVILIDEIETHLHPRWKKRIVSGLRNALPKIQFIMTTHDPLCLRGMDDGEIIVLQRNGEGDIVQLSDLPNVRGMRADQLLTSDYFGLAEYSTLWGPLKLSLGAITANRDYCARVPPMASLGTTK